MSIFEEAKAKFGDEAESWLKSKLPEWGVPKDQYGKKVEAVQSLESQISTLKADAGRVGDLEKQLLALNSTKAEYEEYKKGEQTRLTDVQKRFKAEQALIGAKANPDAVDYLAGLLDVQKLQLKEGKLDGFDEQLESLKKTKPALFASVSIDSPAPDKGGAPTDGLENKLRASFGLAQK